MYMGHRISSEEPSVRKLKSLFDRKIKHGIASQPLNGRTIYSQVKHLDIVFGKGRLTPKIFGRKGLYFFVSTILEAYESLTLSICDSY